MWRCTRGQDCRRGSVWLNILPGDNALGERQGALVLSEAGNPLTATSTGIFAAASEKVGGAGGVSKACFARMG